MLYRFAKRSFDVLIAAVLFILFLPFWIIIPILIRSDSPGRIIFKQKRIGLNSGYFMINKFRTMKEGTPDIPTDQMKEQENYNTKSGVFLRRWSIDEIPQLINIFKGEMSFVGPRPALYNQPLLIRLRKEKGVDRVRPGVTGLAQISGRDAISIEEKVKYDHKYVEEASFLLDLKIIMLTVKAVFSGWGAI